MNLLWGIMILIGVVFGAFHGGLGSLTEAAVSASLLIFLFNILCDFIFDKVFEFDKVPKLNKTLDFLEFDKIVE